MESQLNECVSFFTEGSIYEWIVGGVFVISSIFFSITKHNIPAMLKGVSGKLLKKK